MTNTIAQRKEVERVTRCVCRVRRFQVKLRIRNHRVNFWVLAIRYTSLACILPAFACESAYLDAGAFGPLLQLPLIESPNDENSNRVIESQPIFDAIDGRVGHHAATICALDNGSLIAAWYSYAGPEELDGAAIYTATRVTGESSWSAPTRIEGLPDPAANPVLFESEDALHLLFAHAPSMWWSSSLWQCDSNDGGQSWTAPQRVSAPLGANVRNPPIRLADGRFVLPAYSDFWLNGVLMYSDDGTDWQAGSVLDGGDDGDLLQPAMARRDDESSLLVIARNRGGNRVFVAASADGGVSWTRPALTEFPNPDSAVALMRLVDGSLMMIFNDSTTDRAPLVAVRSVDGGGLWGDRRVIAEGDGSYSYPAITQSIDGRIHILYTENRERIMHATIQ